MWLQVPLAYLSTPSCFWSFSFFFVFFLFLFYKVLHFAVYFAYILRCKMYSKRGGKCTTKNTKNTKTKIKKKGSVFRGPQKISPLATLLYQSRVAGCYREQVFFLSFLLFFYLFRVFFIWSFSFGLFYLVFFIYKKKTKRNKKKQKEIKRNRKNNKKERKGLFP